MALQPLNRNSGENSARNSASSARLSLFEQPGFSLAAVVGISTGSIARPKGQARIETPNGQRLIAKDLLHVHANANALDLGYLQARNRLLEAKQAGGVALSLTPDESELVRVALQVLTRELPVRFGRRVANVRPEMLLRLA